jgi:FMN phosphatase YigB (HAD superfamily)
MAREIRNVVFDIGNVLLPLDYRRFLNLLADAGIDLSDLPAWLVRIGLEAHERGELDGDELLARMARTAKRPLDPVKLRRGWLDMFERSEEMFALATGLMTDYRVYLLSNIGDLHWEHINDRYGLGSLVHGALASFRAGAAKPSAAIYRAAERQFGLEPEVTIFIDDLPVNVSGAEACGWLAIHHRDPATTRAELQSRGVRMPPGKSGDRL